MSFLKNLHAILLLPSVVTVVVPWLILSRGGAAVGWPPSPRWGLLAFAAGAVLVGLGLTLMVKTIALFASVGRGTLAPWAPPEKLVVRGVYRRVRNPMISGVLFVLCGEALLFGSVRLLEWFGLFLLINMTYIPLLEEPVLEARFGESYRLYKRHVPRWLPRLRPWDGPDETSS